MICILHNQSFSYVPSVHPVLYRELSKHQGEGFRVLDAGRLDFQEIKEAILNAKLLVLDQSVLNALDLSAAGNGGNLIHMYMPILKNSEFYAGIIKLVMDLPIPILHWASLTDPHGILTVDLKKLNHAGIEVSTYLQRICGIIWGYNSEKLIDTNHIPESYQEKWLLEAENPRESYDLIRSYIEYDIEVPHCISSSEFYRAKKKWDIEVPGARYITRRIVEEKLASENFRYAKKNSYYLGKWNGILSRMKFIPTTLIFKSNYLAMRFFIARSRASFVCGSSLRYLVRKFLEVPAFHSVMLAYPPVNMSDYGFEDGFNYLHTLPEQVSKKLEYLLADKNLQNELILRAAETVRTLHIEKVRAQQLISALKLVSAGKITAARFYHGTFCYFNGEHQVHPD